MRQESKARKERATARRKPYVFKFRAPDKTFNLSLSFRRSEVDRGDLIGALETILADLRTAEREETGPGGGAAFGSPSLAPHEEE